MPVRGRALRRPHFQRKNWHRGGCPSRARGGALGRRRAALVLVADGVGPRAGAAAAAQTARNPGRQFYKCPKGRDGGCGFFKWADQYQPGAAAASAPSAGAGLAGETRDRSTDTCYKCGGTGHWASECPGTGGGGGYGAKGQSNGYNAPTSPGQGGAGRDRSTDTCYKCGGTGHWASQCPEAGGGGGYGGRRNSFGGGGRSSNAFGGVRVHDESTTLHALVNLVDWHPCLSDRV